MKKLRTAAALLAFFILPGFASAEIYEWIDDKGVKHYSNEPPPEGVRVVSRRPEIPPAEAQDEPVVEAGGQSPPAPEQADQDDQESEPASETAEAAPPETQEPEKNSSDDEYERFHQERLERKIRKDHRMGSPGGGQSPVLPSTGTIGGGASPLPAAAGSGNN